MSKKFGGGCLADMGPYAAATARILGSGKLINMTSNTYKNKKGLITSFNVSCKFKKITILVILVLVVNTKII